MTDLLGGCKFRYSCNLHALRVFLGPGQELSLEFLPSKRLHLGLRSNFHSMMNGVSIRACLQPIDVSFLNILLKPSRLWEVSTAPFTAALLNFTVLIWFCIRLLLPLIWPLTNGSTNVITELIHTICLGSASMKHFGCINSSTSKQRTYNIRLLY